MIVDILGSPGGPPSVVRFPPRAGTDLGDRPRHTQTTLSGLGHHHHTPALAFQIGLLIRDDTRHYTTTAPPQPTDRVPTPGSPTKNLPDGNCRARTGKAPACNHTNAVRYFTPSVAAQPFNITALNNPEQHQSVR
ncbi:hypothetical protein ACFWAY_47785 [Rhodococcus sp. NPDC059968]|uniref:hypothetical protein n=1 Tax=Rhodococcus sp. NPDC059968 TaxID=3347017 RepID=UPI003673144A